MILTVENFGNWSLSDEVITRTKMCNFSDLAVCYMAIQTLHTEIIFRTNLRATHFKYDTGQFEVEFMLA